jgi:hypothetical protein
MNSPLLTAYRKQNFQEFENILASGKVHPDTAVGLDKGNDKNLNLLVYICNSISASNNSNDYTFVELLLKYGANPNFATRTGSTTQRPFIAVKTRLFHGPHVLQFFKLLLDYGADPNFSPHTINTITRTDSDYYMVDALRFALQAGAKKNNPINPLGWVTLDRLKTCAANPGVHQVKNLNVIHQMIQVLESHVDNVPSNLYNNKLNDTRNNATNYKQAYMQNLQQIENQKRIEEQTRLAEQARLTEQARIAEQQRLSEQVRLAEQQRLAEQARIKEQERLAEQAQLVEQQRLAEQARLVEQQRLAEQTRIEEQNRLAEQVRITEQQRLAEQVKITEQTQKDEAELAGRYLSLAINNLNFLNETNNFITDNINTTNSDIKDFIQMVESLKICTSTILLKSGQMMPQNILSQLNIPDEYKQFFPEKK